MAPPEHSPSPLRTALAILALGGATLALLLGLRTGLAAPGMTHLTQPVTLGLIAIALGAALWRLLDLLRRTAPPHILRPAPTTLLAATLLWLCLPVGFVTGLPVPNLLLWGSALAMGHAPQSLDYFLPVSALGLLLAYPVAATLIAITPNHPTRRALLYLLGWGLLSLALLTITGNETL